MKGVCTDYIFFSFLSVIPIIIIIIIIILAALSRGFYQHKLFMLYNKLFQFGGPERILSNCKYEVDFIEHFFSDCTVARTLWSHVQNKCVTIVGRCFKLAFSDVLFGVKGKKINARGETWSIL